MDSRRSFTDIEYSMRKQTGKREELLMRIDAIVPWDELIGLIRPYYPEGRRGRPVKPIDVMLKMYLLQCWFGLSAAGMESQAYDSYAFRKFIGVSFLEEQIPDANTLSRFRRLLKKNGLEEKIDETVDAAIKNAGLKLTPGSVTEPFIRPIRKKNSR